MGQDTIEPIQERADTYESQYNKLKQDFRDYIKTSKRNEARNRLDIKKEYSKRLLVAADSLVRIAELDNDASCEIVKQYSDNTRKNIEVVYNQMLSALDLIPIEPSHGDKFNEQEHTAVRLEYGTKYPENSISRVIRKGYLLENKVIRPAEVIVMKSPQEQKKARSGIWDKILRWINPVRFHISEINQKIDNLENIENEKTEKISKDIESLRDMILELKEEITEKRHIMENNTIELPDNDDVHLA